MELENALTFLRANRQAVLTTIRSNGRPQLSNVVYGVAPDGRIRVSITATRAKYHNLRRTPWAALHVTQADFWAYTVLEADVELTPPAAEPGDPVVDELVEYYREINGEHDDWPGFRASMVAESRVIARLTPVRAYGMLPRN